MTIENAIENYKEEKERKAKSIKFFKSSLAEQKKLLKQADKNNAHVFGDKISYLEKIIKHKTQMFNMYEEAFKNVLDNKIGIKAITKMMREQ
jgi:hypothetical protein